MLPRGKRGGDSSASRGSVNPLWWSPAAKAVLLLALSLPFGIGYLLRIQYLLAHPFVEPYFNREALAPFRDGLLVLLGLSLVLLPIGIWLVRSKRPGVWFALCVSQFCWLVLAAASYAMGLYTTPIWIALIAFGALEMLMLPLWIPLVGAGTAFVVLTGTTALEQLGRIPYAPLISSSLTQGGKLSTTYVVGTGIVGTILSVLVFALFGYIARRWQVDQAALQESIADLDASHRELEQTCRENARLLRTLETMQVGVAVTDLSGKILYANPAMASIHGYDIEEVNSRTMAMFADPGADDGEFAWEDGVEKRETSHRRKDGSTLPVQLTTNFVYGSTGEPIGRVSVCEDITARRKAEAAVLNAQQRYELVLAAANEGIWDWDRESDHLYVSRKWCEIVGVGEDEIGTSIEEWFSLIHPEDREEVRSQFWYVLGSEESRISVEYRILNRDGTYRWVVTHAHVHRGVDGNATRVAGSMGDITARSTHDPLTGLPNRTLFVDRLEQALRRAQGGHSAGFAVAVIDLIGFRKVISGLGPEGADRLLFAVAARLSETLPPDQTLARASADEFFLLLDGVSRAEAVAPTIDTLMARLRGPYRVAGEQVYAEGCVGIVPYDPHYRTAEDVLRDAAAAASRAKTAGKGSVVFFTPELRSQTRRTLELESELRQAIHRRQFVAYFQPILDLPGGTIRGFEALARWEHPQRGTLFPAEFIGLAEESGLISDLAMLIFRNACETLAHWRRERPDADGLTMSVNLSPRQFVDDALVGQISAVLAEFELPGSALKLEITESDVMQQPERASRILRELRELGVAICIDDFGTGHSSLSYLTTLPIDVLKIDRSFVMGLPGDSRAMEVVRATIALAKGLGLTVVAEGIETIEQAGALAALGTDFGQGFLYGRPVPAMQAFGADASHAN